MAGFRAYFDFSERKINGSGDILELSPDESRHLCGSLRAQTGDRVDVFDLDGNAYRAELASPDKKSAAVRVLEKIEIPSRNVEIFAAQCLPKGKVFDEIIRQSVEIGAAGIYPLTSDHCEVKISADDKSRKSDKWTSHTVEAVKQSSNFLPFKISEVQSFSDFMKNCAPAFDLKIVASLQNGSRPILDIAAQNPDAKRVCILVGPEGDMSEREYRAAADAGFLPATLGPNVMKCDTAAMFSLSALSSFFSAKNFRHNF